jgi:hypothetical protein
LKREACIAIPSEEINPTIMPPYGKPVSLRRPGDRCNLPSNANPRYLFDTGHPASLLDLAFEQRGEPHGTPAIPRTKCAAEMETVCLL